MKISRRWVVNVDICSVSEHDIVHIGKSRYVKYISPESGREILAKISPSSTSATYEGAIKILIDELVKRRALLDRTIESFESEVKILARALEDCCDVLKRLGEKQPDSEVLETLGVDSSGDGQD